MIYTVENTVKGKLGNVRVFDANGEEIRFVLRADDVTGECTVYRTRTDKPGVPLVTRDYRLVKRRIICKPPLRVVSEKALDSAK
jgi:hypothetical protein